jgi:thiosulfate/3-mercaptopyruvate sulfurtransferase
MTTKGYDHPELLCDTEWLGDHLDDPNVRVVDCDQFMEYRRAHVRNAAAIMAPHHYVKESGYERAPKTHPLVMPQEPFTDLMMRMGIDDNTTVVTYDQSASLYAARFWWVLGLYGHTNVKVLNGGWKKWFDEGRPTSINRPPDVGEVTFTPKADDSLVCTLDYGVGQVGNADTVFLDVRSDGEWDGSNDRGNARAGRAPGAVHLEWLNLITEDRHRMFKPASELRPMLEAIGVTPDKNVITY